MASTDEIEFDSRAIRIYKSGLIQRLIPSDFIQPSIDPKTRVSSKDTTINPQTSLSARIYLPNLAHSPSSKLPIVIYYHGGAFCLGSAFSSFTHNYLNPLVAQLNVVLVSVGYRLAPEHPIPAAYDDSWEALKWATTHVNGEGPDDWLSAHADFDRLFLAGDSAGGNIVHNMAMRAGTEQVGNGVEIEGSIMIHPYFLEGKKSNSIEDMEKMWRMTCPLTTGLDDHRINPMAEMAPTLMGLGCRRVLVCLGEKDILREGGRSYYERLMESGWEGEVEIFETEGEGHSFHVYDVGSEKAIAQTRKISDFINGI